MPILEPTIERRGNYMGVPIKRVSWSSIISGVIVGVALFVTLSTLCIALGLIETEPGKSPGVLSGISWAIVGALSLFGSGWTAGRLSGLRRSLEGVLHGLVTWAVASVALLVFAGSFSMAVHGTPGEEGLSPAFERAERRPERGKTPALQRERMEIERRAREFLVQKSLDLQQQQEVFDQLVPGISALLDAFMHPEHTEQRDRLVETLVESTDFGRGAVEREVEEWIAIATRGVDKDRRKGKKRRGETPGRRRAMQPEPTISAAPRILAGWSFLFVFLGTAAAMFGGWLGSNGVNGKTRGRQTIATREAISPETD